MLKHQLTTDIRGVNVWPYASVMLNESRSRSRSRLYAIPA